VGQRSEEVANLDPASTEEKAMPIVIGITIFISVVVLGTSGVLQERPITKSDVATVVEEGARIGGAMDAFKRK
jgi:hypothetical protein